VSALYVAGSVVLAAGESKKSGPIGLAVILVLCVGCYFLFKSMSKHLRKVREEFPAPGRARPDDQGDGRDGDETAPPTDQPGAVPGAPGGGAGVPPSPDP
jgi:hypothetical protein